MLKTVFLDVPKNFSFKATVYSHGWCELLPFELDDQNWSLTYVFSDKKNKNLTSAVLTEEKGKVRIDLANSKVDPAKVLDDARHLLRLDDDLTDFYGKLVGHQGLEWVSTRKAGRLLRSRTVFEDLIKTLCTTNCSWGLTKIMVKNLVDKLGAPAGGGKRAFPTATAMASMPEEFYRTEIKAGYRSPYFVELSAAVASGDLDPEAWLISDLSTADLKKEMKAIKGVGDYAAENLLKLVGRYDGLALDSWLRSQFYKKHNGEKVCKDKEIERYYNKFGPWRGLAIWCDMTEKWIA
jgi:3-methyladenine DNA glycosylase/8-oxoguanine DNA glycosylase